MMLRDWIATCQKKNTGALEISQLVEIPTQNGLMANFKIFYHKTSIRKHGETH